MKSNDSIMPTPTIQTSLGNTDILQTPLTAFLCSRQVPAAAVLRCYDWAIAQREAGITVISGFHSPLEQDVFRYLLKGRQPVVLALARGLKKQWEPALQKAYDDGRLLIISPFDEHVKRASTSNAIVRNALMIDLAEQIVIGYAKEGGFLERQLVGVSKLIKYLTD